MDRFHKVSRSEPCPVCGKPDWCVVSNDGGTAICMRVESDRPHDRGGWVHVLKSIAPVRRVYAPPPVRRRVVDMARLFDGYRREFTDRPDSADRLGAELGLGGAAVDRLACGRSAFYMSWCFPMRDGDGRITGIRLRRYGSGDKFSVPGSRDGLFYDPDLRVERTVSNGIYGRELAIVEGASDCAAAYAIGLAAVGRSSCSTGADALKRLCERLRVNRVTIVTDNDRFKARIVRHPGCAPRREMWRPGVEGAERLADDLKAMYRIVTPPKKDLREWVRCGCTAETFREAAERQKWRLAR